MRSPVTRRKALVAIGGASMFTITSSYHALLSKLTTLSNPRQYAFSPPIGGTEISIDNTYSGTLGCGVTGPNGDRLFLTNNHIADGDVCSSVDDTSITVDYSSRQSHQTTLGTVSTSSDPAVGESDWLLIEPDNPDAWSPTILGLPPVGTPTTPTLGDRVVMSGAKTGLTGGTVTGRNLYGTVDSCQFDTLTQVKFDTDQPLHGNSGSLVGSLDPHSNRFNPIGMLSFEYDGVGYLIPIKRLIAETGISFATHHSSIATPSVDSHIEAAIVGYNPFDQSAKCLVSNVGGNETTAIVRISRESQTLTERSVHLQPLEQTTFTADVAPTIRLETPDVTQHISLAQTNKP